MGSRADSGRLVRQLRAHARLAQRKSVAKLDGTFPTINRWENGRAKPSPLAVQKIEELLRNMGKKGADPLKQYFDSGTEE